MKRIIPLAVLFLTLTGCGTMLNPGNVIHRNSYAEFANAAQDMADGGTTYLTAVKDIEGKCQTGKINADDCLGITEDERAVRVEARKVEAFLAAWKAAGGRRRDKPGGYDDRAEQLRLARQKVLNAQLLSEVVQ
jgi:uncharacterized protein YceK